MRRSLLDVLACPHCHASLTLHTGTTSEDVVDGELRCTGCSASFPIRAGVPRFVRPQDEDARIASHFTTEFTELAEGDRDTDDPALLSYIFYSRTGLDPAVYERIPGDPYRVTLPPDAYSPSTDSLRGAVVLDAGCGGGRFLPVAAATGARLVVGMDLGDHIDRAATHTRLDNVEVVQASVLAPPFRAGVFDFVYSIGVLHHTGDASRACRTLARTVAPSGRFSVWVYPPGYWGGPIRSVFNRLVHASLARMPPERAFATCRRWLYPVGRVQAWAASSRVRRALLAPAFLVSVPRHPREEVMLATIYDYFCPPFISTHEASEVESWLRAEGFSLVSTLPVPTAVMGRRMHPSGVGGGT